TPSGQRAASNQARHAASERKLSSSPGSVQSFMITIYRTAPAYQNRVQQGNNSEGTYASAFPVPEEIGQLSDGELEKIARDAVADYEAWKASLPPDARHATERLEKGELIIEFKQDHAENEGQPKRSRERGNESSTP